MSVEREREMESRDGEYIGRGSVASRERENRGEPSDGGGGYSLTI